MGFDWPEEARRLLDSEGEGMASEQYIAALRLALRGLLDLDEWPARGRATED